MENTIVLATPGRITSTALTLPSRIDYAEWEHILRGFRNVSQSIMFWLGDLLVYGRDEYGEQFSQAIDTVGYSPETVRNAMWVASRVAGDVRSDKLSWSHHQLVAHFEQPDQQKWLATAEKNEWTVAELRAAIRPPEVEPLPKDPKGDYAKLLKDAKGKDCVKCGGPDAMAAHYSGMHSNRLGKAMGKKAHDLATAYLCHRCHTEMDSYAEGNDAERSAEFLMLVMLTNIKRLEDGVLVVS